MFYRKYEHLFFPLAKHGASLIAQFGKESARNAGDSSIPRSGRSPGEGIGYHLQYFGAFLVVQLVKSPPAMRETWVQSLYWEDPLQEGIATHSGILVWRIPKNRAACQAIVYGVAKRHN